MTTCTNAVIKFFVREKVWISNKLLFCVTILFQHETYRKMGSLSYQSELVSFDESRRTGCFTTLPIRVHSRNDLADAASRQFVKDWAREMGDGRERHTYFSFSPVGNWSSLIYPEAVPERLGVLAYLSDLGLIHDGNYVILLIY